MIIKILVVDLHAYRSSVCPSRITTEERHRAVTTPARGTRLGQAHRSAQHKL